MIHRRDFSHPSRTYLKHLWVVILLQVTSTAGLATKKVCSELLDTRNSISSPQQALLDYRSSVRRTQSGTEVLVEEGFLPVPYSHLKDNPYVLANYRSEGYVRIETRLKKPKNKTLRDVVLVHGFSESSKSLEPLADAFLDTLPTRVIRLDLINSGNTLIRNGVKEKPDLTGDASILGKLFLQLNLRDVILVGHSRGHGVTAFANTILYGRIALSVAINPYAVYQVDHAMQKVMEPTKVMGQLWAQSMDPFNVWGLRQTTQAAFENTERLFLNLTQQMVTHKFNPLGAYSLLKRHFEQTGPENRQGLAPTIQAEAAVETLKGLIFPGGNGYDVREIYKLPVVFSTPLLVIKGQYDDKLATADMIEPIIRTKREKAPNLIEVLVENGGHFLPREMPQKLVEDIANSYKGVFFNSKP